MTAHLLPPNARELERDTSLSTGTRLEGIAAPLQSLWHTQDTPAAWLPVQAWGLSVDEWDVGWSEGRMRDVIAQAIEMQRRKGTIGSVRRALASIGHPDAVITEGIYGWRYGDGSAYGDPGLVYGDGNGWAMYQIDLAQPITPEQGASMRRLLALTAPVRCHINGLVYTYAPWVYGDGSVYGAPLAYYAPGGSVARTLISIAVTPENQTIARTATQQFTATGTYSDGSTSNVTASVAWSSGNTSFATISAGGLATGVGAGDVTIVAALDGVSGSTVLTIPWGSDSPYSTGYATNRGFFVGDSVISYGWDVPFTNYQVELQNHATGGKGLVGGTAPNITDSWDTNWPLRKANTDFVILQGGVNDIKSFSITVAAMKVAMQALLDEAIADVGASRVYVWNIAPWGNHAAWTAGYQAMTEEWNAWLAAQALIQGFILVDMYALLGDPAHPEDLLAAYDVGDGIHPSPAGVWAQYLEMSAIWQANDALNIVNRAHVTEKWVGGVEPAAASPTGNQIKYWVGAVEPAQA